MQLSNIVNNIPDLSDWSHAEKIKLFAWYLHYSKNLERFNQADLRACYDELHLEKPSNVSPYIKQLQDRKPKEVISDKHGYYLEKRIRDKFQAKYGQRSSTVQVDKLLLELLRNIPNVAEKVFLERL